MSDADKDDIVARVLAAMNATPPAVRIAAIGANDSSGQAAAAALRAEYLISVDTAQAQFAAVLAGVIGTVELNTGTVSASPTPNTTSFSATGAGLTGASGAYRGMRVLFQDDSGNIYRAITSHSVVGSRHDFVLASDNPLPSGYLAGGEVFKVV